VEIVYNMTLAHLAQAGVLGTSNGPGNFDPSVPILTRIAALADGVRLAARLVDAPPNEMHTDAMVRGFWRVCWGWGDGGKGVSGFQMGAWRCVLR
jgi:hypothetical protein